MEKESMEKFCLSLIVALSSGLAAAAELPVAMAVRAAGPVQLDGVLEDPAWESAPWFGDFTSASAGDENAGEPKRAEVQTRFKVLYDDQALYVAVQCDEPNPDRIVATTTERDGTIWADDCVEIFFDPENEGRYFHQVMANSRGVLYDCYAADYGLVHSRLWNGAFHAAGHTDPAAKQWSVEVAIPFGAIVLGEKAGGTWRWNVTRERHAGGGLELTSWAPLKGNFHQPRLFGALQGLPTDYSRFRFTLGEPQVSVSRAGGGVAELAMAVQVKNETGTTQEVAVSAAVFGGDLPPVRTGPTTLAHGAEATFTFPALTVRASLPQTDILFEVTDPAGETVYRSVVKNLSTEYRPLTLKILRPCYRNNIYASENLKELVFRVELSPEVRPASAAVAYRLTGEGGQEIAAGRVPVAEVEEPVKVDIAGLPVGRFQLTVQAVDAQGVGRAEASTTLRKLPPPPVGNEVRIDENRNVLVNGQPFFGLGWYGNVPTEDPRADVVALQNVQTPVVVILPDTSAIARNFEEHGIRSIVSVENGRLFYSFNLWREENAALKPVAEELKTLSEPSADLRKLLTELVEAVRGEPGLLGYYIADEPEINNTRSDYLENQYRLLCELDPYHPVFITNDTLDGIVTHGYRCADVLNPDPYSPNFDYVPNFLKKVNEVGWEGKSTYVTLWHASGQAHTTAEYGTAPPYSYRVFRHQYLASIAYGAKGFTAYTTPFFLPEIEYRYGLPHVWRELRFLEKAILAPAPPAELRVDAPTEMGQWIRGVDGQVYLILVNHKPGDKDVTVSCNLLRGRKSLTVLSEGRTVAVDDGAFRDHFAEGDVHVYTDDPAAAQFPTVAEVTAELADRTAKSVKPGNLLHWTHGTRAVASGGYYAPWFEQYYYYAINGITDDVGWWLSHAQPPQWLELTLPRAQKIGRVVVYTPNLRDYDLQLFGPDGTSEVAEIRDNPDEVAEHHFEPAIPTLKLRLTARAVREGAEPRGAMVREIEAYETPGEGPVTPTKRMEADRSATARILFPAPADGRPNALWSDDFTHFEKAEKYNWDGKDTKWVLNEKDFRAAPQPGGGIVCTSTSEVGYAAMTHLFPYDPAYRFLQVKLSDIQGEGYQFTSIALGVSSGAAGYRGAINTARRGIYTVDTHYISENFRTGQDKTCFLTVSTAGSSKQADGTVKPGPEFTFDWVRLVRDPEDGLLVTQGDGSPLGDKVKPGDTLHFELHLSQPAADATVEVLTHFTYSPLPINGQPYVQLHRADETGKVWVGEVTLGEGTGQFKPEGYPVVFKAAVAGGAIQETYASAFVEFGA